MDKYKKFLVITLIMTSVMAFGIIVINYKLDPYGLFRTDFSKQYIEPNQNIIKMKFILDNPEKYDSFVFGSSRVGKIDVTKIPNGNYYNMTYSEGLPSEHLANIKILLENGVEIKNLLIGIDDFSYKVYPEIHLDQTMRRPYKKYDFLFYAKYLFNLPDKQILSSILFQQGPPSVYYDIYDSGMPLAPEVDDYINANKEIHVNDPKFTQPFAYRGNRIEDTLEEMKGIKEVAKENNVNVIFFINPIHQTTYLSNDIEEFNEFKIGLAEITDYYDFSGLNTITTDNFHYYETSHYRVHVGDLIIDKIVERENREIPEDFGVFVTEENVQQHVKSLIEELN